MKRLTKATLVASAALGLLLSTAKAQLTLSDFTTNTTTFAGFTGAGFAPTPGAGQLDSDTWKVNGMSEGAMAFGDTKTTASTDFTRGQNPGTTGTGGVFAWTNVQFDAASPVLGVKPGTSDFTPGSIVLKLRNTSGITVTNLYVSYVVWIYNSQERANSFNFSYSSDDSTYTAVPALNFTSPEAADATPVWAGTTNTITLTGLSIANNGYFYLQWSGDDVSGSDNRDAFGLDNVGVAIIPEPSTWALVGGALLGMLALRRRRS